MAEIPLRLHTREQVALKILPREERGKGPVGQLRRNQGLLPGVLYGHKQEPIAFKTEARTMERLFSRFGQNAVFVVEMEGAEKPQQAIVRQVQYHKVNGDILHLDLLRIDPDERLRVTVPLHTIGLPEGVRLGGGAVQHAVTTLDLECVVSEMPSSIEIDITTLEIGDSVHVADLLAQESRIVTDPEVTIVNVLTPRLTVDEETPDEEVEEGEVVEGEEGEEGEEGAAEEEGGGAEAQE